MNILLVDDDQINSKIFSKRLEKRGYQTEVVSSGEAALAYLKDYPNVIVLLDIVMPEMDGVEVLKTLREKWTPTELPVIMMSARDETEQVVECLNLGANDYITKPVNIDIAIARIEMQMSLSKLQSDNLKKQELQTANAMIATYNHEINNPLTIALGLLKRDFSKIDEEKVKTAVQAMERISEIVKKIDVVTSSGDLNETEYVQDTKMIKLD